MSRERVKPDTADDSSLWKNVSGEMFALLIVTAIIGWYFLVSQDRDAVGSDVSKALDTGALTPYIVQPDLQLHDVCGQAECTYAVVAPVPTRVSLQYLARYVALPTKVIAAPAGQVIRDTQLFSFYWYTPGVMQSSNFPEKQGYILAYLSDANLSGRPLPAPGDPIIVPTLGYVRSAKAANSDQQYSLSGDMTNAQDRAPTYAGDEGHLRLHAENPAFASIEFQPLDKTMAFEVEVNPENMLNVGDAAEIYFSDPRTSDQKDFVYSEDVVNAAVTKIGRGSTPATWRLELSLPYDNALYQLMTARVSAETKRGKAAFPERMWLKFAPHFERNWDQILRVPATAIVRDEKETHVWAVIDDRVTPIWVQVVDSDGQSSVIIEKIGARGLPIRPEHWAELDGYGRSRLFRHARNMSDPHSNKLLSQSARIIARPDSKLQPGAAVRSVNDTSQ